MLQSYGIRFVLLAIFDCDDAQRVELTAQKTLESHLFQKLIVINGRAHWTGREVFLCSMDIAVSAIKEAIDSTYIPEKYFSRHGLVLVSELRYGDIFRCCISGDYGLYRFLSRSKDDSGFFVVDLFTNKIIKKHLLDRKGRAMKVTNKTKFCFLDRSLDHCRLIK